MDVYTASHWGVYQVDLKNPDQPHINPAPFDPDPSPIGLHQLDQKVTEQRVRRPSIRKSWLEQGPGTAPELRGKEPFVEVDWQTALDLVAKELDRVRSTYGNSSIYGGSYGWSSAGRFHHAQSQIHRFLNMIGGYVSHKNSYSLGAAKVIMPHIVGSMDELITMHTTWDVLAEHTELFVSFGGVPAKNSQISPGGTGKHAVRQGLYAMKKAGVRFVNVGPVDDNLDVGGDREWIQCRPNTDTALMIALAWELLSQNLCNLTFLETHCTGFEKFTAYLTGKTDGIEKNSSWAEAISGVPQNTIKELAQAMASSRTMLNIAWSLQRSHHGEQPYWMLVTLAAMLGQIGLPGGGFGVGYGAINSIGSDLHKLSGPTVRQGTNPVRDFIPVARIADMLSNPGQSFSFDGKQYTYPDIHLIYWAGGNPYHHHQDFNRLNKAWEKPDTVIVNEQFWTATAKRSDIVLPATTGLERNDIGYASQEGVMVAMSKVASPVGDAWNDYDTFSGLAERLGVGEAFTEGRTDMEWLRFLYDDCKDRWQQSNVSLPSFDDFWKSGILHLEKKRESVVMFENFRRDPTSNPVPTPSGKIEIFSEKIDSFAYEDCPGHACWLEPIEWLGAGSAQEYPLHLLSDQPARKLHSQLDSSPHSQSGKINGHEPISMNPEDAKKRGIHQGDTVEVFNQRGRCIASAVLTDKVMPGVVRISTGAWYDPDPETGLERHGNPNVLTLDLGTSSLSQGCSAHTCLVDVRGPVKDAIATQAFVLPEIQGSGSKTNAI
ncbi:MAG: molybdopterin guanine dinucleotide-containing S/N-oxide reductase [Alphaproteobacteria bacterium]|nr:molybdopterin guanine dinucleotide-containing S/N-oxide reductase [Alphaproteobacteria bacterium]